MEQMKFDNEYQIQDQFQSSPKIKSQFLQKYQAEMNPLIVKMDSNIARKLFEKHDIKYDFEKEFSQFTFEMTENYLKYEMIKISVLLAFFKIEIMVLNQNAQINNSKAKYQCRLLHYSMFQNEEFAVKSFYFNEDNFSIVFESVLLEWSILKICSILQCGPRVSNYLGFDIIVNQNCIQIAMEKGIEVNQISSGWFKILKEQLQIMHSFNIIHGDIKPQNIIFSPYFNKVVFIDFGLSSLIREGIGQKKRTSFTGSTGYCSEQMLALFSIQPILGYVDLYYNDLFGLNTTFQQLSKQSNYLLYEIQQDEIKYSFVDSQPILNNKQYFIYKFKYYYVKENRQGIGQLFKNKSQLDTKIHQILEFIRNMFHRIYLPQVFEEHLQYYSSTDQYKAIENMLHSQRAKIRIQIYEQPQSQSSLEQRVDYTQRYSNILLKNSPSLSQSIQYCVYYQFLTSKQLTSPNQNILCMIFECLRFNIKNITFTQKNKLATKWAKILFNKSSESPLDNIITIFQYFVGYCQQQPFNQWKKQNFFEVIYHAIILGLDANNLYVFYKSHLVQYYVTITDKVMVQAQLNCLLQRLESLDLASNINQPALALIKPIYTQIYRLTKQIESVNITNLSDKQQQIVNIHQSINKISLNNIIYNESLVQLIKRLKSRRLRNLFENTLKYQRLRYLFQIENLNKQQLTSRIRSIIKYDQSIGLDILTIFRFSQFYLHKLQIISQFKKAEEQIKDIIGCSAISQRLEINKILFLIDLQNKDKKLITRYLKQFQENYFALEDSNMTIERQLSFILRKIGKIEDFQEEIRSLVHSLYAKFKKANQNSIKFATDFQTILSRSKLQKHFIKLLPELLNQFQQNLGILGQQLEQIQSLIRTQNKILSQKIPYYAKLKFYHHLTKFHYYQICNNCEGKLFCLVKLIQVSKIFGLKEIYLYLFYQTIDIAKVVKQQTIYSYLIRFNYQQTLMRKFAVSYLHKSKKNILIYTLQYFHKTSQEQKIVSLLHYLNEQIVCSPLQSYVSIYLQNLQRFYFISPNFFSYKSIRSHFELERKNKNPYLSIFYALSTSLEKQEQVKVKAMKSTAFYLDKLTSFTRQKILQKYDRLVLSLKCLDQKMKKMYLIRYCKKYLNQKYYFMYVKRRLKSINNSKCVFKNKLKEKCLKIRLIV